MIDKAINIMGDTVFLIGIDKDRRNATARVG